MSRTRRDNRNYLCDWVDNFHPERDGALGRERYFPGFIDPFYANRLKYKLRELKRSERRTIKIKLRVNES